jgi:hypothetical protein
MKAITLMSLSFSISVSVSVPPPPPYSFSLSARPLLTQQHNPFAAERDEKWREIWDENDDDFGPDAAS